MRFLILAHRHDSSAAALIALLRRRHPANASRLVTLEELLFATSWAHRIDENGVRGDVMLHDGWTLHSAETGVVLQRLGCFDLPQFGEADRAYAVAEMSALLLSFLEGFQCPVINPVSPRSLCLGRSPTRWFTLAAEARLPLPRMRSITNLRRFPTDGLAAAQGRASANGSPVPGRTAAALREPTGFVRHSVLLAGEEICGDLPQHLRPACLALARLAETPVLQLHFTSKGIPDEDWFFESAEAMPTLNPNGLLAVVRHMEQVSIKTQSAAVIA